MSHLDHMLANERRRQIERVLTSIASVTAQATLVSSSVIRYREHPGGLYGEPARPGTRAWPAVRKCREARLLRLDSVSGDGATYHVTLPCGHAMRIEPAG